MKVCNHEIRLGLSSDEVKRILRGGEADISELKELYLRNHQDWQSHYDIGDDPDGSYLYFKPDFLQYMPKKASNKFDEIVMELIDTRDNNKIYHARWSLNYEDKPIRSNCIFDMNWEKPEYLRLRIIKLCTCNIKAEAKHAGAIVENEECEDNYFLIRSVIHPDAPDLILYSEMLSDEELEEILLKGGV